MNKSILKTRIKLFYHKVTCLNPYQTYSNSTMSKDQNPPPYGVNPTVYPPGPPISSPPAVVVTNTVIQYGPDPQHLFCPYCHANITTRIESNPTTKTHISALLLCCFLCWPCAFLPYCMDSCQSRTHYCPSCNAFLGSYNS